MADYLHNLGYKIIVSEWYPIVRYGTTHKWRGLKEYPCKLDDKNAWGNFICFQSEELLEEFKTVRASSISLYKSFSEEVLLRKGSASGNIISVRAIGFLISGHQKHHLKIFEERYF